MSDKKKVYFITTLFALVACISCKDSSGAKSNAIEKVPPAIGEKVTQPNIKVKRDKPEGMPIPEGMVWIPGGEFMQGAVPQIKWPWSMRSPPIKLLWMDFLWTD